MLGSIHTKQKSETSKKDKKAKKKVLLREHRRHTAHRVASARCAVLSAGRYSNPGWVGIPILSWPGVPQSYPGQEVLNPDMGVPQSWQVCAPWLWQDWATPLARTGVPSKKGARTSDLGKNLGLGVLSPSVNRQTPVKTVVFPSFRYGR